MALLHQLGFYEFGTFDFRYANNPLAFSAFFRRFSNPALAQLVFRLLEDARVDWQLTNSYRGIRRDLDWLKAKIDAGATSAITQFFFKADTFLRFRDRVLAAGIDFPIIPGIFPVENWAGVKAFAKRAGSLIPPVLDAAFSVAARDGREELLSLTHCTQLCDQLLSEGVEDLHFYTLNRPQLTRDTCLALGLKAKSTLQMVA